MLPNLETLWVTGNMLTGLTDELTRLYKLDNLRLDRNELTFLPSYIGEMTSLTHLGLNDNKITKLPPEMANLTKLESLVRFFRHFVIFELSFSLSDIKFLFSQYLAGNPLPEHLAIDAGTKEQTQALLKAIAEHFAPKKKEVEPEGPQPEKITAEGNNNNNNDNAKKDVDDEQPVIEEVPEK